MGGIRVVGMFGGSKLHCPSVWPPKDSLRYWNLLLDMTGIRKGSGFAEGFSLINRQIEAAIAYIFGR
jgi:hypothetical protein